MGTIMVDCFKLLPKRFPLLPGDVPSGFNQTNGIGAMMAKKGPEDFIQRKVWCIGASP